ncbi:hypothetical protein IAT38_007617 [Cryptococcus sp. DSM 104549]
MPHPPPHPHPHASSSASHPSGAPPPPPATGRGIKGFFTRGRVASPEPPAGEPATARSRLRSFMGDGGSKPSASSRIVSQGSIYGQAAGPSAWGGGAADATARGRQRTLSTDATAGRQRLQKDTRREAHPAPQARPTTPTERTRRHIRFNHAALPHMQKGDDGKWQTPSLSRGSVSTSALHTMQQDDDEDRAPTPTQAAQGTRKHKHALSGLFQSTTRRSSQPATYKKAEEDLVRTVRVQSRDAAKGRTMREEASGRDATVRQDGRSPASPTVRASSRPPPPPATTLTPPSRQSGDPTVNPPTRPSQTPSKPFSGHSRPPAVNPPPAARRRPTSVPIPPPSFPPTSPTHAHAHTRQTSSPTSDTLLSREHYLLRLSTSFLVKTLTPVIRGSAFVQNERNAEMKRLADDRLTALARMEKAWGADWARAAGGLVGAAGEQKDAGDGTGADGAATGAMEAKIRMVHIGDRAKERERKAWSDAIKDGILLCFLLNHLFPASPSHITRVNISEDGIQRSTNVSRFITACQTVGLPPVDVFFLPDIQEGLEVGLGRVAQTVIALARLAGPRSGTAVARSKSPPGSRPASRPPSRNDTATPTRSPPITPRRPNFDSSGMSGGMRSAESFNDLHSKLQSAAENKIPTPPSSNFVISPSPSSPVSPSFQRSSALPRSATQPNLSPSIRHKSPPSSPASRSVTPVGRVPSIQLRPVLRPRNTTGSRVSFASDEPGSPRVSHSEQNTLAGQIQGHAQQGSFLAHSRERTPSLITSSSRVNSAYTRSSGVLSVATVLGGDEHGNAIDLTEEDEGTENGDGSDPVMLRMRERRMSEKKLQEARQKILGTLLSSEDLPKDLREAINNGTYAGEDERDSALSKSLAALEGNRLSPRPKLDPSPRHRQSVRRRQSSEVGRQEANSLVEEDEQGSGSGSPGGSRVAERQTTQPFPMRRLSSSGKVVVPKRSGSPASRVASPTGVAFPASSSVPNSSYLTRDRSPQHTMAAGRHEDQLSRAERVERRQSGGYPRQQEVTRPGQLRNHSMVNLSNLGQPSLSRETSATGAMRSSHHLQVIEFREQGSPVVKYQLGNCIGRGQFGSVYRSLNLGTGQMAAIKRIRLHGMPEAEVKDVMSEVELLKRLSHPSIVKYEGMSRDEEYLNIVLEFVENGSLGQTLKAFGVFNEKLVSSYVAKILEGLDYLHSQGVVHCDLKSANILSTKNGNVKLSDFGVSLNMKAVENIKQDAKTAGKAGAGKRASEVAGTPNWMAPEVISLAGASFASDIWSLGCTIIELLTGKPPYSDITNSMTVLFRIVEDDMPPLPEGISSNLTDFLKLCFIKDPKGRPSAAVLFEHPWLQTLNPELQALRSQDSMPFLRRVSMDLRRVDSARLFEHESSSDATRHRPSLASSHGRDGSDGLPKAHVLVKTTFGKAMVCRVCHTSVKKGVLCQGCGMISHISCASIAPPRCDIHEQLAILARQEEMFNSVSPSQAPTPRASFDNRDSHLTALPGKILLGLRRSSRAFSPPPSRPSQVDLTEARHHYGPSLSPSTTNLQQQASQPSMDVDNGSRSASLQNRSSLYSSISEYGEAAERPVSGVQFELGAPSPSTIGLDKMVQVGVVPVGGDADGGRSHARGRESKSECVVQ